MVLFGPHTPVLVKLPKPFAQLQPSLAPAMSNVSCLFVAVFVTSVRTCSTSLSQPR